MRPSGGLLSATRGAVHGLGRVSSLAPQIKGRTTTAARIPAIWARMNPTTPDGAIPAKVSESARASVTAGLAKVGAFSALSNGPAVSQYEIGRA
jgi:hypothetical protein